MNLFAPLTYEQLDILHAHLNSGWRKQVAEHGTQGVAWDTFGLLGDTSSAMTAAAKAAA